jgi:hypothetical protein
MSILQMRKLDAMLRLFDGDISLTELVHMDLPSQRALVQSRIDNLKESQEKLKNGIVDSYSISRQNVLGELLYQQDASSGSSNVIAGRESRNARSILYQDQH